MQQSSYAEENTPNIYAKTETNLKKAKNTIKTRLNTTKLLLAHTAVRLPTDNKCSMHKCHKVVMAKKYNRFSAS